MTSSVRSALCLLAAAVMVATPLAASAQSRASVVSAPAVVVAAAGGNGSQVPANVVAPLACTPTPGYVCPDPTPLPPGSGNSCFRGNSAGVSRCPR